MQFDNSIEQENVQNNYLNTDINKNNMDETSLNNKITQNSSVNHDELFNINDLINKNN